MERLIDLVQNFQVSDGFQGNTNTAIYRLNPLANDAADDILKTTRLPGGLVYTGIEICTEGNTAGLTLDVGWRGAGEHRDVTGSATQFADGVTVAATARDQLLNIPFEMSEHAGRQVAHELTFTLGGTITAGEMVYVLTTFIDNGRL